MKRIHYFRHVPFENLGSIETWARERGCSISQTRFYDESSRLPEETAWDWLIVMGGPMGVDDEHLHPWLRDEKQAITRAIQAGKVVLGICLGAQLIASALGAAVRPNAQKEIGWLPVRLAPQIRSHPLVEGFPDAWTTFHWHGDTFDLPDGAVHLAVSDGCKHQGFIYRDRVVALQFHMEMTPEGARDLVTHCAEELVQAPYIQKPVQILDAEAPYDLNQRLMSRLLDHLALIRT